MKKTNLTLLFLCMVLGLSAQQDMMMYNMHGVPQSSYSNPANRFDGKFYIGLPGLSSNYFNFSNTVRYSDVIIKDGDSLLLSFDNLIAQMEDENYFTFNSRIDLISGGFNVSPSTQILINVTEVVSLSFDYNKDLIRFIYEGNTAFLGTSPNLDNIGINASHYREYGIGASHQLNEKLRLGARFKYLYGMENIYTERSEISMVTDPESYALTAETDIRIHTAGLDQSDAEGDEGFADYFNGRNNSGFAVDLGAFYELNDKFSFSASIVDLGYIRWNDFTRNYTSKGNYLYDGVDIDVFGDDQVSGEDSPFDQILDSIETELGFVETKDAYTSPLITKVYLGGNYEINERSFAGLVVKNDIFKGQIKPSFSLSYGRQMTKWITLTGGYSALNGAYDNISMGAVFDPGPVQFYVMTDNLLGMVTPQNTRNLHIRFGINLIFGREKEDMTIFNKGSKKLPMGSDPIETEPDSSSTMDEAVDSTEIDDATPVDVQESSDSLQTEEVTPTEVEEATDTTSQGAVSGGEVEEDTGTEETLEEDGEEIPEEGSETEEVTEEETDPGSEVEDEESTKEEESADEGNDDKESSDPEEDDDPE